MHGHAVILAALAWLISSDAAEAKLDILVDKSTQRMLVIQDGYIRYMWPVSTGRDNMQTPNESYTPQRLERNWFSAAYYIADAIFDLFLSWLRDPWQLRDRSAWDTGIAWIGKAASTLRRNTV